MPQNTDRPLPSRRDEYAEATRLAVVDAARGLFGSNGHARTTVEEIARRARVSPSTVYAQCGGKQGLLETLMDTWTTGTTIQQIIDSCHTAKTGRAKLSVLADGYLALYRESGDIARIVTEAAATSPSAESCLRTADTRHRDALAQIVASIRGTGALSDGLSDDDVVKAIYYHFRHQQLALTIEEFGWSEAHARDTIRQWVERAIMRD